MGLNYKFGELGYFMQLRVDLGDAVADQLAQHYDQISLEMIYRGLAHFTMAHHQGKAIDPVKYFAAPENRDLGIIKQQRKPNVRGVLQYARTSPLFLTSNEVLTNSFSRILQKPLDKKLTALTCHQY